MENDKNKIRKTTLNKFVNENNYVDKFNVLYKEINNLKHSAHNYILEVLPIWNYGDDDLLKAKYDAAYDIMHQLTLLLDKYKKL